VRLRGRTDLGSTLTDVLNRYAEMLTVADSKLMIVSDSERIYDQLVVAGAIDSMGEDNFYRSDEWVGRTLRRADHDAQVWVDEHRTPPPDEAATEPTDEPSPDPDDNS